jgi:hypothetical protein
MTPNRHPKGHPHDQDLPELEAWLERVVGLRHPDPAPVVRDLDE